MPTLTLTDLAPGRTATLQLYERGTNTAVGSLITGTSSGTTYSFVGVPATGDYDAQLAGFTTPNGARFPVRNGVAYVEESWAVVDASIFVPPIAAAPTTPNTCAVTIRATQAGDEKQVRVLITSLGSTGRLGNRAFVNKTINENTDAAGLLVVQLPWSSTPGVGKYRVRLLDKDSGEVLHDRVCTVPDEETLDYEELPSSASSSVASDGLLVIREVDGDPSGTVSTLVVPNGSLSIASGVATLDVGGGGGGGDTNLSISTTSTTVVVASDTGTDATLTAATGAAAGVMTAAMFTKLDGITSGATANSSDATLLARANHTGTQAWSTITSTPTTLTGYGITDAVALTTNTLAQFAATTSLQLAGVISDETGSGALVFATSPTLVTPILGTPTSGTLTNCTGLPTAGIVDAAVTLAKMANLAQDQFIGRTTASTGVPQTATITAAARTVLDDTTVAAMVDTLGGATSTGTGGLVRATSATLVTPNIGLALYTAARTTEITSTPTGTTQTITLGDGNHQTLSLASTTGNPTITLTVPASSAAGTLILIQHGTTPRSITWAVSSGSILWMGGQPTWASDAVSTSRVISWRWNGSVMRLAATEVGA
jgi:uncharacterized ParB-like nuclease family protein